MKIKALHASTALLWLLLISAPIAAMGQQLSQTIRGKIIDKESQEPLIGATVAILTTNPPMGTTTDVNGPFRLDKVPVGRHTLRISYMGYEEQVMPELLLGSGKELVLNIGLSESFTKLQEIVISAEQQSKGNPLNEMAMISSRSISVEETKRYAASVNDPARAAQNYAGVGISQDMSNEIVVRGNSPRGVLWRVEGIEVPNPSHFAEEGAAGGAVSSGCACKSGAKVSEIFPNLYPVFNIRCGKIDKGVKVNIFDRQAYMLC